MRVDASSGPVRDAALRLWDEIRTARLTRRTGQELKHIRGAQPLKVHLGCGADVRSGWINVDMSLGIFSTPVPRDDVTVLINHDLRRGLPLGAGTCDYIYSSHFFEHLSLREGTQLMRDCLGALRPGGTIRISVPDFRACCEAYLRQDQQFFDLIDVRKVVPGLEPETECLVDWINYVVYQHGEHRCMYDTEKLIRLLRHVGFSSASASSFDPTIDPDTPERRRYSLYVEARK